jgi:SulP family sulfate permease
VLVTMVLLAGLFEHLPAATLGAVVIDAMLGLITFVDFRRYYGVNRPDWLFFMGAGLGILFLGITAGILIGVVLSLLLLIARSSRTSVREVERDPDSGAFLDLSRNTGLEAIPGVLVARVDGPLFFADADHFRTRLRELVGDGTPTVIVDAESIHLTDTDGADILSQVAEELRAQGAGLRLAAVHPPVLALWQRAGVLEVLDEDAVYATVDEAVATAPTAPPALSPAR